MDHLVAAALSCQPEGGLRPPAGEARSAQRAAEVNWSYEQALDCLSNK